MLLRIFTLQSKKSELSIVFYCCLYVSHLYFIFIFKKFIIIIMIIIYKLWLYNKNIVFEK